VAFEFISIIFGYQIIVLVEFVQEIIHSILIANNRAYSSVATRHTEVEIAM
jgi:hypothetical protein